MKDVQDASHESHRSERALEQRQQQHEEDDDDDDTEEYSDGSVLTPSNLNNPQQEPVVPKDCTETVHQMHEALLYLLSNPEEFSKAISYKRAKATTSTLQAWEMEYDRSTDVMTEAEEELPIPFVVFAEDAEVVLPQAHTASQLFGVEREGGVELEAAAGVVGLSTLFLRWLALMPSGDHMNVIDPPGLTVMRIAGGRYRVTAAHRVVWTWQNEFLIDDVIDTKEALHFGNLVTMTIVDVFETDSDGKLLSYCPTFDNRAVKKTDQRVERIIKSSSKIKSQLNIVAKSPAAAKVNRAAAMLGRLSFRAAVSVKDSVQKTMEENKKKQLAKAPRGKAQEHAKEANDFAKELEDEVASSVVPPDFDLRRGEHYVSDDDTSAEEHI